MEFQELIEAARAEVEWHKVAAVFPLLPEDELRRLATDIKRAGLIEPILFVFEEGVQLVVDGRNRQMACIEAGVDPVYKELPHEGDKDDLASLVWSLNYSRRHLSPSQLGMAAAEMRKFLTHGTIPEAAIITGASKRNTERADRVLKDGSGALIESVQAGEITLFDAEKIVSLPKKEQTRRVKLFKAGKIRNVSRVPTPKPNPETQGDTAWLKAVQEPYDVAIGKLNEVIAIVQRLEADVELSMFLPTTRTLVDLEAAKNNLYQNYPLYWHGGPEATAETHPQSKGVGFLTRFVWAGLSQQDRLLSVKEEMNDGKEETADAVQS
tara:strand:- start:19978 stop:20949 length:972 start_codon:yes stop_codon:yes gene_type:complete